MSVSEIQRPVIVIVGRPNVGKSTLFNRFVGRRKAIVASTRGTTRDRLYGPIEWRGVRLTLVDTGGFEFAKHEGMAAAVQDHLRRALQEADGFVLICDAQEGLVPADEMILEHLRKTGKPILLAANKADHRLAVPPEFFSLGVAEAYPVSALHGRGTLELLDQLAERFSSSASCQAASSPDASTAQGIPTLAIVGRQNVGKSSLLNALLREERVIVSEAPGTTRDAIDTHLMVNGEPVILVDTAGLRHRRKVRDPIDFASMARTIEALNRCDVALVVLDATQGVTRDDQRIMAQVYERGRGCLLLLNKWDLMRERGASSARATERTLIEAVHRAVPAATRWAPVLPISAKTGFHVSQGLTGALGVFRALQRRVPDAECFALLEAAWRLQPPPRFRGRVVRLQQAYWVPGRPVRVEIRTRPVGWLPRSYQHYLLRRLYADRRLAGVPIQLIMKDAA
ncbi:MAG: ribosome biogenesis GTPase Der [Candidatus Omnitrophica bacterium]|nr:ribosome biogenesis GTPase Der [Candidatus Omnitrophota bacterium]